MIGEMHHTERSFREMDLAEKMAERRGQSLAAASKRSGVGVMGRMLLALAVATASPQAEGRA